jgi:breast cancer metastasis-suppressor 1-like protein
LPDRRRKPVPVSGPFIVYMLRDNEILDDWAQIKKACKSANSMAYYA